MQSIITSKPEVETVVFDNPDKKSLGPRTDGDRRVWKEKRDEEEIGGLDMKKARFEFETLLNSFLIEKLDGILNCKLC
jgi:hypothetical protein